MNSPVAEAIFVLSHYDARGTVTTSGGRLLDTMNDSNTRYLKLDQVRICPRAENHTLVAIPSTILIKSHVHAVVLIDEHRRNESKVFFATLVKKTVDVVITLPTVVIEGRAHPKMANDPQTYLSLEAGLFYPVTAAKIQDDACEGGWLESSVVFVNKELTSSISFKSS